MLSISSVDKFEIEQNVDKKYTVAAQPQNDWKLCI
jgi:hypothetical protein